MKLRPLAMAALAFDGLRRKIGRNLLTMSGVFISVRAMTIESSCRRAASKASWPSPGSVKMF